MLRKKRIRIIWLFSLFIIAGNAMGFGFLITARAEQNVVPTRFTYLEIQLWPEYDLPAVWISLTLHLDEKNPLPAPVIIRIPTAAGIPNYVAVGPTYDALFEIPYQRKVDGEWSYIIFSTAEPIIRIEYDDPTLTIDSEYREFQFTWYKDYEVENIYLQIQQPYGVRTMNVISPFKDEYWFNDEVLRYYSAHLRAEEIKDKVEVNLSYRKENNEVTVEKLQVRSRTPITENTAGKINWWNSFPWVLVSVISILLIMVGGLGLGNYDFAIIRNWTPFRKKSKDFNNKGIETPLVTQDQNKELELHCPQCGNRVRSKDRYCRVCGSPL